MSKLRMPLYFFIFLGIPGLALPTAYLFLAWEHSRLDLWNVVVHENGVYTLAQSIFYFSHFIREIPVMLMTAFAFAASFYLFTPVVPDNRAPTRHLGNYLKILIFIISGAAGIGAVTQTDLGTFLLDLGQFKTRDSSVLYGSHWHSHFFHILGMLFAAGAASCTYRVVSGRGRFSGSSRGVKLIGLWFAVFILISCILGFSPVLTDMRYLAHQVREIMTHSFVTLPLSFALLIMLEEKSQPIISPAASQVWKKKSKFWGLCSVLAGSVIFLWMLIQLRHFDILANAQKQSSITDLLASHSFEHSLDYLFVPLVTGLMFLFFLNPKSSHEPLP